MSILSVVLPAYNEEQMVARPAGCFMKSCQAPEFLMNWFLSMMDQKITHGMKY